MARDTVKLAASLETENTGGLLSGFLAEEDASDRRTLWRLASWGAASVGAVILGIYANQSSIALRHEQVAVAADLSRQAEQIQTVAKESQSEVRRLASAVETLNGDRDRLYSRVTVLEQGLETMTGAIAKQATTASSAAATAITESQPAAQSAAPAPVVSPVATAAPKAAEPKAAEKPSIVSPGATPPPKAADKPSPSAAAPEPAPATVASHAQKPSDPPATATTPAMTPVPPQVATRSMMGPPDAAASKLIEPEKPATPEKSEKSAKTITAAPMPAIVALATSGDDTEQVAAKSSARLAVQRTEFGVDVGGANSVGGLRALWRGLLKSRSNAALTTLRPIIVIKEASNGLGMQLRLVAGPLGDAAAAAKICAGLIESERPCSTTVFDGQRLAVNAEEPAAADKGVTDEPVAAKPAISRYSVRRRGVSKRVPVEEPAKKPDPPSTLSTFFRRQNSQ